MGDKLPDGCLISLTDIPPDFEKHLKLVAERVQAMMISANEYNRDNDEHDGAIFMTCLMDALTSMYCDAENRPAAGLHIHSLTSVFSEGAGPAMAALCAAQGVSGLIDEQEIEIPNIYACIKRHPDNRGPLPANDAAINILIQSTKGSVTISEIPAVTDGPNSITSFIARSPA